MTDFDPAGVPPASTTIDDLLCDDLEAVLREMNGKYAVVKPGGKVLIGIPDHFDPCLE
jgi:hypothetical protein